MTLDKHEQNVVDKVQKSGWMVMNVRPNRGDADPKWFAYTIGLSVTHGMSEMILFGGRDDEERACLVNNAIDEMKNKKLRAYEGLELVEVMENYPVQLTQFPFKYWMDHLGWSMWYARHCDLNPVDFNCFQIVWPDKFGRFPTDPDCVNEVRDMQTPVLTSH